MLNKKNFDLLLQLSFRKFLIKIINDYYLLV